MDLIRMKLTKRVLTSKDSDRSGLNIKGFNQKKDLFDDEEKVQLAIKKIH